MAVSLFDSHEQLTPLRDELKQRIAAVVDSGRWVLGPEVRAFERELADFLGVGHVVGVANGTDAIRIVLQALDIGLSGDAQDEVVVPSFTFVATAEAVVQAGARPVFCDVDPETFCVSARTVEEALTPRTRAIIPVHLFGRPAPMKELGELAEERGLHLVEDAAQAVGARLNGARVGSLGDAAAFSFYPSKNLFCLGDGGAIATNDERLADRARLLRVHGSREKTTFKEIGWNSRLDELQATVLRVLLPGLDERNALRRDLADAYEEAGLGELVKLPRAAVDAEHVYHLYVVRSDRPAELLESLSAAEIEARPNYEQPLHRQVAMRPYAAGANLAGTEEASRSNLALPMGPTRGAETVRLVVEALRQAVNCR